MICEYCRRPAGERRDCDGCGAPLSIERLLNSRLDQYMFELPFFPNLYSGRNATWGNYDSIRNACQCERDEDGKLTSWCDFCRNTALGSMQSDSPAFPL